MQPPHAHIAPNDTETLRGNAGLTHLIDAIDAIVRAMERDEDHEGLPLCPRFIDAARFGAQEVTRQR